MIQCVANRKGGRCQNDATANIRTGCVHEHVGVGAVCEECLYWATGATLICLDCEQAPDGRGHRCLITVEPLALASP